MSNEFHVRLAQAADAEVLAGFNVAMAWETEHKRLSPSTVAEGVRAVLDRPEHGFYIVAEAAEGIVGALLVTFEWSDWRCGQFWWIQSLYVRPDFRRRGVFNELRRFLKVQASHRGGVCGFRLYVEKSNLAAQDVYENAGMKKTSYQVFEETF